LNHDDHRAARDLASAAGALLLEVRTQLDRGVAPELVRRDGDRRSNEFLLERLRVEFPDDAVLSEEAPDDGRRLTAERTWIIDPLDGTREFGEAGRSDWAVHVALLCDGRLSAGAVGLPGEGLTLATDTPPEAPATANRPPRIGVSRTRPAPRSEAVAAAVRGELVPMGSAGAKAMAVVRGTLDVYVHTGGQHVWDSAAPVAVAAAAGLHTSRADGSELRYDGESTWLPDLVICRPELAGAVLGALGGRR
jgi:3'(2'), 5'-bisphosphate nucleotidase